MNKKVLLFSLLLSGCLLSLSAQEEFGSSRTLLVDEVDYGRPNQTYNTYKTNWKKNQFKDNWVISIAGGGQTIFGEDDKKADFKDRITFAPQISIGKYFSPIWGLKLQFTGGALHGFNDGRAGTYTYWNKNNPYVGIAQNTVDPVWLFNGWVTFDRHQDGTVTVYSNDEAVVSQDGGKEAEWVWRPGDKGELYMQKIHYMGASVNFMFDVFNLLGSYNPKRFFEVTPFAGIGYYQRLKNQGVASGSFAGINGGLTLKFRLADRVKFQLEGNAVYLPTSFDGHMGSKNGADGLLQGTAGLSFNLGKTDWQVIEPMDYDLIDRLNKQINDLRNRTIPPCPECPPPPPVVPQVKPAEVKFLPDPVFFRIDKSVVDPSEWAKIDKAVDYLNSHHDVNVVVTGYADKKTAYPEYNMKLSERRAKTVAQALTQKYGINPLRVSVNWSGDQIQPFKVNEWNRVVIFVIE